MVSDYIKMRVSGLNLFYGNFQALKDIDIEITENKVTALIGPSGCGKSTFIRSLNRMNDLIDDVKISGTVEYEGADVYKDWDVIELRKRVGMVFQKPNPFPMSVYENIAYGPRVHGGSSKGELNDLVESSLAAASLWDEVKDRLHKPAMGLSGGQQQRLCIARVLAVKPDIILMDEPTSALDPVSTSRIEDLMDELKKDYTIIIVTHNMQQAGRVSDKTAFFLHGAIEEFDSTDRIFFNPRSEKTEAYISGRFG